MTVLRELATISSHRNDSSSSVAYMQQNPHICTHRILCDYYIIRDQHSEIRKTCIGTYL